MAHPYLTEAQVTARVGGKAEFDQLTDDDGDGAPDPAVLEQVMGQVDALLDGWALRGGYTVPLADADAETVLLPLLDIANYKLRTRGNRVCSEDDRLQWQEAMKVMEAIAGGSWEFPSGPATAVTSAFGLDSAEQLFNREELKTW